MYPNRYASTGEAYAAGYGTPDACEYHRYEVLDAIRSWTEAADMHEHTSYYGAAHVRHMRAWWLGVLRKQRQTGLGWHTFHAVDRA